MNHYPRHVGDITQATFGLSLAEFGCYDRLLDAYYSNESPLPLDPSERYRLAGAHTKADRTIVDYVVGRFFVLGVDGWHNKRADEEIAHYRERSESASQSAKARWCERNANAMPTHTERNANQNQEPITIKTKAKAPALTRCPPEFGISERVKTWAAEKGHTNLTAHLDKFMSYVKTKQPKYADWDEALMACIRDDWAKVGPAGKAPKMTILPDLPRRDGDIPDAALAVIAKLRRV